MLTLGATSSAALLGSTQADAATTTAPPAVRDGYYDNDVPEHRLSYIALEGQAMLTRMLIPSTMGGGELAMVIGGRAIHLRVGAAAQFSGPFALGIGRVSNNLQYGFTDVCVGKTVFVHRIRTCVGGEAGIWNHRWRGFRPEPTHRRFSPHVAGTIKGDYHYAINDRLGLMLGAGVSVVAVGPSFRGTNKFGTPTALVIPGPLAGTLRMGATFRFR